MDAGTPHPPEWAYCGDADYAGGTILECGYQAEIQAPPEKVWNPVVKIGGPNGYYYGTFLWRIRGYMDKFLGGIGSCGRRHSCELRPGDALDFFRVQEAREPERLMLVATMKVPGEALLDIQLIPIENAGTRLQVIARFLPRGIGGILYWYLFYPFHGWLFKGMLKEIADKIGTPLILKPKRIIPGSNEVCYKPTQPIS
jgi:hypothetical protein